MTIKKIAKLANVSPGTVDRIIHNRGQVSKENIEKVNAIIKEYGYNKNIFASNLVLNPDKNMGVGLEINANHLRMVKSGFVTGICTPIHIGGKTHIWDIKLYNDLGKITCVSRLTVAVVPAVK